MDVILIVVLSNTAFDGEITSYCLNFAKYDMSVHMSSYVNLQPLDVFFLVADTLSFIYSYFITPTFAEHF
jgi:hypothetical protein